MFPGYNLTELTHAVNETPSIPSLSEEQLPQVIYHCRDIYGNLVGNSFCINGCLGFLNLTTDDECQIAGNGTCPPGNGTVTITSTTTTTRTVPAPVTCVRQCQTWCIGGNCTGMGVISTDIPVTLPAVIRSNLTTVEA